MTLTESPPPDVFISYARANRALAEQLADGLAAGGLRVWWDRNLVAGSEFASVIEARLLGAAVVIVMWSSESVHSSFVRDESSRALKQGKLLPVRIEDVELPLGFGQLHTLDLLGWDGDAGDDGFQTLLFEVSQRRQQSPGMPALARPPLAAPPGADRKCRGGAGVRGRGVLVRLRPASGKTKPHRHWPARGRPPLSRRAGPAVRQRSSA